VSERYRILRFIKPGGMGEVYEADDLGASRTGRIETLRPEMPLTLQHRALQARDSTLAQK